MIPKFRAFVKSGTKQMWGGVYEEDAMVPVGVLDVTGGEVTVWGCGIENCGMCDDYFRIKDIILMQGWESEYQPELTIYKGDIINVHWFYANHDPETLGVYEDEVNLECVEIIEVRGVLGFYVEDDFLPLAFVPTHEESFEVIGNIYEDGKLLEE